ncbi:alpha-2 adrenergic receptor-like [Saccostrea echinata]|uniref:alpha-2 adrenergic receptor-like n=1 Tax=Saccostrea echinata TaxID=191078 RepID=UPI002A7EB473|nr:alpha-2 adrenergic receptor-like [Saccostrea echinata]
MNLGSRNATWSFINTDLSFKENHSNSGYDVRVFRAELMPALIFVSCLLPIGIIGNGFVCCIYHKKWRESRRSSRLFILSLAWIDLSNCSITMPFDIALMLNSTTFDHTIICKSFRYLTFMLNCMSSIILIGIAVDRFIGIRFSREMAFGVREVKNCILFAILISALTCWPVLLLYGTQTFYRNGVKSKACLIDNRYKDTVYPFVHSLYLIVSSLLVDLILIILYLFTWRSIHVMNKGFSKIKCYEGNKSIMNYGELSCFRSCCKKRGKSVSSNTSFTSTASENTLRIQNNGELKENSNSFGNQLTVPNERNYKSRTPRNSMYSITSESMRFGPKIQVTKSYIMLFSVTVVYICTFLPFCVIAILRCVKPAIYSTLSVMETNLYQLFLRSYMLNMAANPVVYCFVNKDFRNDCKKLFTCSSNKSKTIIKY